MTSQTNDIIESLILPQCKNPQSISTEYLKILIQQARNCMSERQFQAHRNEWKILGKKLSSNDKLLYLKQQNCRVLIIDLIREDAMHLFNSSYLNRAKIDGEYIRYMKQLGPHFFIEIIMIVSKLKTIHKHFYNELSHKTLQDHVSIKVLKILELCNQKKRSINNNKAKFLCIVQDQNDRVQITKQLGKMLREAWKKEKTKCSSSSSNTSKSNNNQEEEVPTIYAKKSSGIFIEGSNHDYSEDIRSLDRDFQGWESGFIDNLL